MKKKSVWYLVGVLILALALVVVACAKSAEKPTAPAAPAAPVEQPAAKETAPAAPVEQPAAKETAPAAPAAPATLTPPNIPAAHSTSGCPVCHEQGLAGAPKWPASHAGYTEQLCAGCHKPAG